eukprot:scaffold129109_cov22-Tisochrysis_lutea.AAC.3
MPHRLAVPVHVMQSQFLCNGVGMCRDRHLPIGIWRCMHCPTHGLMHYLMDTLGSPGTTSALQPAHAQTRPNTPQLTCQAPLADACRGIASVCLPSSSCGHRSSN